MRIGSSWKDIEKNIDTILSYEYINLSLTSTIQIDNLFLIPKLIIFAQSKKLFLSISAHSFVYEPEYLNIRILPQAIKKQVEVFYNRFLEKYNIDEKYQENLHNIIMYMNS